MARFLPGQSGNPAGRPRGSRNKVSEAFVADLAGLWERRGAELLERLADDEPATLVRVVAGLAAKTEAEIPARELSRRELHTQLRAGIANLGLVVTNLDEVFPPGDEQSAW